MPRTWIDHLIYAAPDLDAAIADLEGRLGVRAAPGGRHEGIGTHNALLAVGPDSYLELIARDPTQPEPQGPRPFGVDAVDHPRLVGWAVACDDIDVAVAAARGAGHDPGDPMAMTRTTPDGRTLNWRLTLGAVTGGAIPFLIQWDTPAHPATTAPGGVTLDRFVIEDPQPDGVARALNAFGCDVGIEVADKPALVAHLDTPNGPVVLR